MRRSIANNDPFAPTIKGGNVEAFMVLCQNEIISMNEIKNGSQFKLFWAPLVSP